MRILSALEIANAVGGELFGNPQALVQGVCIDSRKSENGWMFAAIKGENVDGNIFAKAALSSGCSVAITNTYIECPENKAYIKVSDTVAALQRLAEYNRNHFDIKLIGVTGSVGKTTTKEMVYKAVSAGFETHKTEGNFNN